VSKTPRALKDVWVEEDRSREGDILKDLFAKIQSQGGEEKLQDARQYFLKPVTYGDVTIDGQPDNTKDLIMRGQDLHLDANSMLLTVGNLTRRKPVIVQSIRVGPILEMSPYLRIPSSAQLTHGAHLFPFECITAWSLRRLASQSTT
jgi:hypothetical protein